MSAMNLRNVKREFSQLNYRPDVGRPQLLDEIEKVLRATDLRWQFDDVIDDLNALTLIDIIKRVFTVCVSKRCDQQTEVDVLVFLAKVYTEYCVDDAVKRAVTKCFKTYKPRWKSQLLDIVSEQLIAIMKDKRSLRETEYFLKTLNECCENFPKFLLGCVEEAMVFLELILRKSYGILICESSPTEKISAIRCIHEGFRYFLSTCKNYLIPTAPQFSVMLDDCFMELLGCDQLPMETLFNCCLSLVYLIRHSESALVCWEMCSDKLSTRSDLTKLGFCVAVLNTFTCKELKLIELSSEKSIFAIIYDIVMEVSCRNLNDSSILISSSRVLFVISKRLCTNSDIRLGQQQLDSLISVLLLRLDHFLDGVRHLARDTMINLIKIEDESIITGILEILSTCDTNSKAFVTILTILSDKVDSRLIIKYLPRVAEDLIHLMSSNNSAVKIYMNLMLNHYSNTESKLWFDTWLSLLFRSTELLDVKQFEQILTKAVELTPDVTDFLDNLSNKNELSLKIHLMCFKIDKRLSSDTCINYGKETWLTETKYETVVKALHSNDENIRFIAIHLILDSKKRTQIFTYKELELMKYFITYNCKNEKASIKQIHLSFVKKLLIRMNESKSFVVRNSHKFDPHVTSYYTEFQHWFSKFCFDNLFSGGTFFRRNFCLESLRLIQTITNLPPLGIIGLNEDKNVTSVLNCLNDTYEQNKILAKDILTHKNQDPIKLENSALESLLKSAKELASSYSPLDSVTAGYLYEVAICLQQNINDEDCMLSFIMNLIKDLKKEIDLAEDNLTSASLNGPMYGLIYCIRHLLNACNWKAVSSEPNWTDIIENLSSMCLKCIEIVSVVVTDSSPEGIVPMDDSCQNDHQVTSQMILLCSWRSTKEASLLLSDIVAVIAAEKPEFSDVLITRICSCLTLLLSETKHRGAFEQIFVAYQKVCSVMWKSPTLHKVPLKCLDDVLTEIKTGLGETFCLTRRSAGMPFIIQALICTNHDKRKIVDYTMETLIGICENKNITTNLETGVVHAMNVLRALFRCSQLGDLVGPFVSRAIKVSIVLFNSSLWPIRNASTLLLSALINRVFGIARSSTEVSWKNRMTSLEFFQRYPELFDTFLCEFKKFSAMDMRPSLYPTLLILARLYPSPNEATDCVYQLKTFIPYIFKCAQSPVMKTRMLAATSIASQVTQYKLVDHLYITYNNLFDKRLNENTVHGLLIQMFSLVKSLPTLMYEDFNRLVTLTRDILAKHDHFVNCSCVVQEVFLRCITSLWLQLDKLQYDSVKPLYTSTLESVTKLDHSMAIGQTKYLESATLFLFSVCIKAQTDFSQVAHSIIESKNHCRTTFEVLSLILCKNPVEYCGHLEKFKNLKFWNQQQLIIDQLTNNSGLVELICQHCSVQDSLVDVKYLVLSSFTPALCTYFKTYISIDDFISKLSDLRGDSEIAHALLCVYGCLSNIESLESSVILRLIQVFESIHYAQRSDNCKIACIDIIVDYYNLIAEKPIDVKIALRLWTLLIHYAEDNSEGVRNRVWRLMDTNANCSKSFELLFEKFEKYFDIYPAAVLTALLCWAYLDIEQAEEANVFSDRNTSEFKEHAIRQSLALQIIDGLTKSHPETIHLKIDKILQEWITEEWTCDLDAKPTVQNLSTIKDFMAYSKDVFALKI